MIEIPKDKLPACIASAKKIMNHGNCSYIKCLNCPILYIHGLMCLTGPVVKEDKSQVKQFLSDVQAGKYGTKPKNYINRITFEMLEGEVE